ncbi:hypothetical protein LQW54_000265 [Pestalotiopsis sp. IQ-011]
MSSPAESPAVPIQWTNKVYFKFYEPVVLLEALNTAARETAVSTTTNESNRTNDPVDLYHAFVYKLAHVCDNAPGGETVTSVMILRTGSTGFCYYFGSNQRSEQQLDDTKEYVGSLLQLVRDSPSRSSEPSLEHDPVLRLVLLFNQERLTGYLSRLELYARECLANPSALNLDEKEVITSSIQDFVESSRLEAPLPTTDTEFTDRCEELLRFISTFSQSPAGAMIQAQARQGRMLGYKSQECWSEFQHNLSRILAYADSVSILRKAQKKWPMLFYNLEIQAIPSSQPISRSIRQKSQKASEIVGRMTRKQPIIDKFREYAESLQNFDLDARIKQEWSKDSFRPIVHAEVLLLDWLERNGGTVDHRFFNDWKYIGSSKPTCKLCHYYFESHGSMIPHRPSHGNLYISWRVPDIYTTQGEHVAAARQVIVDKVLDKIRKDAFDLVEQRVPPSYKDHDSNTFSARVTLQDLLTIDDRSTHGMDNVARLMQGMTLGNA